MNTLNSQITDDLVSHLNFYLKTSIPTEFYEVFEYALIPTGKLFRANLIWSSFCDFNNIDFFKLETKNHPEVQLLSSSVELHHAYTLIHDDLPCMDDDDFRRGKESTHKKYNEWIALLAGDGLLNLSYELLSDINHPNVTKLIKNYSSLCGPTGLILGQYLDLKQDEEEFQFNNILKIHELKTSNLFTCCLLGSAFLSNVNETVCHNAKSLGKDIGILFQIIDDLTELCDEKVSHHEAQINPWINEFSQSKALLIKLCKDIEGNLAEMPNLKRLVLKYVDRTKVILKQHQEVIENHLKNDLGPIIATL